MSTTKPAAAKPAAIAPLLEDIIKPEFMGEWVYQAPAKNKKETGMVAYINKSEGTIENASFQFGHVDAWLLPALGRTSELNTDHFVCQFPFGVSEPFDKTKIGIQKRLNLECSFKCDAAKRNIQTLENNHVEQNVKHAKEWFPKLFEVSKKDLEKLVKDANTDEDNANKAKIAATKDEDDQKAAQKKFEKVLIERNVEEQIRSKWKSNLFEDVNGKHPDHFRAKINTEGGNDGPACKVLLLSLQNGTPVLSPGTCKDITKFSRGIPIFEQTPGLWYQPKDYGCSYTVSKLLLIPAPPKETGNFNFGDIGGISMATEPVDRSQFKGVDPDADTDDASTLQSSSGKKRAREEEESEEDESQLTPTKRAKNEESSEDPPNLE